MIRGKKAAVFAVFCAVSAGMCMTAFGAEASFDMRKKAVNLLGIMTTGNLNSNVSRAEFAKMLTGASEYRHVTGTSGNVSVFAPDGEIFRAGAGHQH